MGNFWKTIGNIGKTIANPVGTLISGATSILGSIQSNSAANKQLQLQQEENQKNRDFNAAEAEKARQFNSAEAAISRQFNAQQADNLYRHNLQMNEYNSPASQMQRLKDAGLNPNLAYGSIDSGLQISGGTAASSSPASGASASASGSVGTSLPDASLLASIGKTLAETRLINAQVNKTNEEGIGQNIQNEYLPQLLKGQVSLQGVELNLGNARYDEVRKNIEVADGNLQVLQENANYLSELYREQFELNNLRFYEADEDGNIVHKINPEWLKAQYAAWRQQQASANLTEAQAAGTFILMQAQAFSALANAEDARERAAGQRLQNEFFEALHSSKDSDDPMVKFYKDHCKFENGLLQINYENFWTLLAINAGSQWLDTIVNAAKGIKAPKGTMPVNVNNITVH